MGEGKEGNARVYNGDGACSWVWAATADFGSPQVLPCYCRMSPCENDRFKLLSSVIKMISLPSV